MKEAINKQYNELFSKSADFRRFVADMEKYSTKELIALYRLPKTLLTCLGTSGKPS